MKIEYKATGHQREVSSEIGRRLVKGGIAKRAYATRTMPEHPTLQVASTTIAAEISPRTGRPKRQYNRRDMQAEGT